MYLTKQLILVWGFSMKKEKIHKPIASGELKIGEISIPCAVLEDGTRVMSQRSVLKALGKSNASGGKSDAAEMPEFLRFKVLKPYINSKLDLPKFTPIKYLTKGRTAYGLKAELLPKVCDIWVQADRAGVLSEVQKKTAERAYVLLKGFAHTGIIALVDEATGYQDVRAKDALAKLLEKYLAKEYRPWTKTFPVEFYQEIFRLRKWDYNGLGNDKKPRTPSVIGHYTNNYVYDRLAPGVLEELKRRNPSDTKGSRKTKHHQWFNSDYGHPLLKEHLAAVIALMKASPNWTSFERNIERAFPKIGETINLNLD